MIPLSKIVVIGMKAGFPTSDQLLCDTYSGSRIAPSKAHFLQKCPQGLLKKLCPDDLAVVPPLFYPSSSPPLYPSSFPPLYPPSSPLQNVDNNYLTTILQQKATSITSMYKEGRITVEDIVEVAKFLKLTSSPDSAGLPLLPLADGTLAPLSTAHTIFYCPPQQHKKPGLPFPPHLFLDPKASKEQDIYDLLQVQKLDNSAISRLISSMMQIPKEDILFPISQIRNSGWKDSGTSLRPPLGLKSQTLHFERFPLIPTYNPGAPMRISFGKLTRGEFLFIESSTGVPLDACVALGMKPIKASDCREKVRKIIESHRTRSPEVHNAIIDFFVHLPPGEASYRLQGLNHDHHLEFSLWFRELLSRCYQLVPDIEKTMVKDLPLWESVQIGLRTARFVSANAAVVIPEGVSSEVVRTWAAGMAEYIHHDHLLSLMKAPILPSTFYTDHLSFPDLMTPTPAYNSLLEKVLHSPTRMPSIRVPNANGRMIPSDKLYLSSNDDLRERFRLTNRVFPAPRAQISLNSCCVTGV
jgi:hypothetical protein